MRGRNLFDMYCAIADRNNSPHYTVITIRNQAWMDSVGLCMWAELESKTSRTTSPTLSIRLV